MCTLGKRYISNVYSCTPTLLPTSNPTLFQSTSGCGCSDTVRNTSSAMPESARIRMRQCPTYIVPCGISSSPCLNNPGKCIVPSSSAFVPVSTSGTPASQTTALRRTQALQTATDSNNPSTRFEMYFRPKPPQPDFLIVGPERLPNLDPITPDRPCVGISRFAGSSNN